jgi:hypothetical protein
MPRFRPTISAPLLDGWFAKESLTLLAPDGQANVIASSEPLDPDIDTEKYASVQGELLRTDFPGYRELALEEADIFGDRKGVIRRFEWEPPDGVPVTQIQIYYAERGRGYTATCTTPSTAFPRYEFDLREVLDGLMIEAVSPGAPTQIAGAPPVQTAEVSESASAQA